MNDTSRIQRKICHLGDVATYVNGYAFKPSDWGTIGVPIIRIQDLTGNSYQENYFAGDIDERFKVSSGDILISWSASLGVFEWTRGNAVLNQHIFKVIFNKIRVDKKFFVHQLKMLLNRFSTEAHGATMKHLTRPVFNALPFYAPPLKQQQKIASVLEHISNLIEIKQQQLAKLDQLAKSRFIEMFHAKGYPILPWNDVFITTTGKLDSNAASPNGLYPFFTCSKEIFKIDKYAFEQEALLLAGNNASGKYDVKYYNGKFNAYQRTYVLKLKGPW